MKATWCSWYAGEMTLSDLRTVAQEIRRMPDGVDEEAVARISDARRESIVGTFLHRREWTERLPGIHGLLASAEVARIRIQTIQFRLSVSYPHIELFGSRSAGRLFLKELKRWLPAIDIQKIQVAPMAWLAAFEVAHPVSAIGLVSTLIPLNASVSMKASFEGTVDIRPVLERKFSALLAAPRKLVFIWKRPAGMSRVELGPNASARIQSEDEESRTRLRVALVELDRRSSA